MPFTDRDKNAARVIVSIFETHQKQGNPAALAVLDDDAGLSYGQHQGTHGSGSLEKILRAFAALSSVHQASAAKWADVVADRSDKNIVACSKNVELKTWLKQAGATPEMRLAQERVFDIGYMGPAMAECEACEFTTSLALAVVYDAHIQGGWAKCKSRTNALHKGPVDENYWIKDYLHQRIAYLGGLASQAARNSVYRPKAFQELVKAGNWALKTPMIIRGVRIEESDLA